MLTHCFVILTTKQIYQKENKEKPFYSVKLIFQDHWESYKLVHHPREIENTEVEKMLSCKDNSRGGFWFYCKTCKEYQFVPFGCNSRLCSCCGKRYSDKWSCMLAEKLDKHIIHRHLVFGIPDMLWNYFQSDRKLSKVLMDIAYKTIREVFSKMKRKDLIPGVIEAFHPFGKDLKNQPHTHMLVTEGGFDINGTFVQLGNYIPYNALHKTWEYNILKKLKKLLPQGVVEEAYRKYPNGFCVYVREDRISSRKGLVKYIGRYVRHPAIANSRIISYNGEAVKFYWKDHEDKIHYKIMLAHDFIFAIIQHIPEKNQKLVRYYGAYSRRKNKYLKSSITKLTSAKSTESSERIVCYCPKCYERMEFVFYSRKDVPPDKNFLSSWLEMKRLS